MMWLISLVIYSLIQGLFGEYIPDCSIGKHSYCRMYAPTITWGNGFPPNEEELIVLCPRVMRYLDCLLEYSIKCAYLPDETKEATIATHTMIRDLCVENSRLNRAYLRSSECFRSLVNTNVGSECHKKADIMYNAYILHRSEYSDVDDADRSRHRYCLEQAYKMSCIAMEILDNCNEFAYDTFLEIIHRVKLLHPICSKTTIEELNEAFIDYIDEEEEQEKVLYQIVNS
ncbi:uncharacterized protein TNCT_154151 [Trichonephila clavata]|uniref:Uncharacterized protein n=1 Tax=Trichonephila clavata TaxID=2740835 RepID=A0A8X6L726_TRICU|nr:uncharacterized protein TNCT_154151 [Trichonephila clavata]